MAKLEQGILGPFRGKVGTVVGYTWRGMACVRAYRKEINYPNTEHQQAEREWFVSMVRFAARARQALLLGLHERAAREQMTEGNLFVKINKHRFHLNPNKSTNYINPIKSIETIDYNQIVISSGAAAPVLFTAAVVDEEGVLHVSFEKNSGMSRAKAEDRVYVYAYCPATDEGLLSAPTERRTKHLHFALPDHWRGHEVQLWGFVVDREGRASRSAYIHQGSPCKTSEAPLEEHHCNIVFDNMLHDEQKPITLTTDEPLPPLRT